MNAKVEESATMLAPQVPYTPDTINAPAWQTPVSAAPSQANTKRQSKLFPLLVVAVVLIGVVVGLGGGGIYLYLRAKQAKPPVAASDQPAPQSALQTSQPDTERNTVPASTDDAEAAAKHYRIGKSLQEEAALLDNKPTAAAARNEKAVAEYRKALKSKPTFPEARENLGVALYDLGKADEAVAEYEVAIKQYPKPTSQVLTNYGMALIVVKRFRDASEAFSQALALQPSDADLHYYRGFALHHAGDQTGSRAAFAQYLNAAPQGAHAKDVREILAGRAAPALTLGGR
jgi:Flp pilus assembly protein TadD